MAILEVHKVTTGADATAKAYYCLLAPNTYANIGTVVGITKVTDEAEKNNVITPVSELIKAGVVLRMICGGKNAGKSRSFNLLVTRDKIGTALDGIKGKVINGTTVGAGRIKRTSTFY